MKVFKLMSTVADSRIQKYGKFWVYGVNMAAIQGRKSKTEVRYCHGWVL